MAFNLFEQACISTGKTHENNPVSFELTHIQQRFLDIFTWPMQAALHWTNQVDLSQSEVNFSQDDLNKFMQQF